MAAVHVWQSCPCVSVNGPPAAAQGLRLRYLTCEGVGPKQLSPGAPASTSNGRQ